VRFFRPVAPELEALVLKALAWDRNKRPIARELAAALHRLSVALDDSPPPGITPASPDTATVVRKKAAAVE
jgi:hypothetical protein